MTKRTPMQDLARYALVGTEFAAAVGVMVFLGVLADRYAGTEVVFTLLGAAIGFAAAVYRLARFRRLTQDGREDGEHREDR